MSETSPQPKPIEEIAGDAMAALILLAIRSCKQRRGEPAALAALDALEAGAAQIHFRVAIGDRSTRFVGGLQDANGQALPLVDIEILRADLTH